MCEGYCSLGLGTSCFQAVGKLQALKMFFIQQPREACPPPLSSLGQRLKHFSEVRFEQCLFLRAFRMWQGPCVCRIGGVRRCLDSRLCVECSREEYGSPRFPGVLSASLSIWRTMSGPRDCHFLLEPAISTAELTVVGTAAFCWLFGIGTQKGHSFCIDPPTSRGHWEKSQNTFIFYENL